MLYFLELADALLIGFSQTFVLLSFLSMSLSDGDVVRLPPIVGVVLLIASCAETVVGTVYTFLGLLILLTHAFVCDLVRLVA